MTRRTPKELGASCSTCDNGDRKSLMKKGEMYCKRTQGRVSINGLCESYKHAGANLVSIERRAREGKLQLTRQLTILDELGTFAPSGAELAQKRTAMEDYGKRK